MSAYVYSNKTLWIICLLVKAHKFPFHSKHALAKHAFDLVYMDIWTSLVLTNLGFKYFLLIVDDFSIFVWIYFLYCKNQVYYIYLNFSTMIERKFYVKIKEVQTDGWGEFIFLSTKLHSFRFCHHVTCLYTSEQNGVIESRNKQVVEMGLAIFLQSSVSIHFYHYAFRLLFVPWIDYLAQYSKFLINCFMINHMIANFFKCLDFCVFLVFVPSININYNLAHLLVLVLIMLFNK